MRRLAPLAHALKADSLGRQFWQRKHRRSRFRKTGRSTSRRATNENPADDRAKTKSSSPVNAKESNHVWQIDLTVVPTAAGLWTPWFPFALQKTWPFCWWVGCVVDHYSRTVVGFAVFSKQPTSIDIRRLLGRLKGTIGTLPKYIVSDKGRQFDCDDFRAWSRRRKVSPRYASTDSLRATAVIERFIRSLKDEWLRCIRVPYLPDAMQRELSLYKRWFERHRPHQGLDGRTPLEVADGANQGRPAIDPKQPIELIVHFHAGRKELPRVSLKNVA
jgi:transposase InsO family protein